MGAQKHFNLILPYEVYLKFRKEGVKRDCSVASLIRQGVDKILGAEQSGVLLDNK